MAKENSGESIVDADEIEIATKTKALVKANEEKARTREKTVKSIQKARKKKELKEAADKRAVKATLIEQRKNK